MKASVPSLHISSRAKFKGEAKIFIQSRKDAAHSGVFSVDANVHFDPAVEEYPAGPLRIKVDLSDSAKAVFDATSIELINAHGKHNPTIILTGRCKTRSRVDGKGLKYWIIVADNKRARLVETPDVVGFVINDNLGNLIAYGTGPVVSGDLAVAT